jgi:hypothetical protein
MGFGDWRAPFPFRFGGGAHKTVQTFYQQARASRPDMLRGGEGTNVDIENKTIARIMAAAWRDTERRVASGNPSKLSNARRPVVFPDSGETEELSALERWERIFGIVPRHDQSERSRRAAVKSRMVSYTSANLAAVTDAMIAVFGDWFISVTTNSVDDIDYAGRSPAGSVYAYWSAGGLTFSADYPGQYDAAVPWRTGLAIVCINMRPPAATEQREIDAKTGEALRTLDAMLPAWMSGVVSQWAPDQTEPGFYLDVSHIGLTAL